jgi:prophage DNA circulation protein
VGRRIEIHQYPLRDDADSEDLGKHAGPYEVEGYVHGDDYDKARDALIAVLEQPGPKTLVHPKYGRVIVVLARPAACRESSSEGGIAWFTMTFVQAGSLRQPAASVDTQNAVDEAAIAARASAETDFSNRFNISQLPGDLVANVQARIGDALSFVDGISQTVADFIQLPGDLAAAIYDGVKGIVDSAQAPLRALKSYESLFNAGDDAEPVPLTTNTRITQAKAVEAVYQLMQRAAVIEACAFSATVVFESTADAQSALNFLSGGLDKVSEAVDLDDQPIDDDVYSALSQLRRASAADLKTRSLQFPIIREIIPDATTSAIFDRASCLRRRPPCG